MSVALVIPPPAPRKSPPSRRPSYWAIGDTLYISARFLMSAAVGNGTIARADALLSGWSRRIFRAGNAGLRVYGLEHLQGLPSAIVMTNHRSLLDIPTLIAAVPGSLRMVMKQELLRVPVWGPALVGSGFIPVDRRNTARAIEQLEAAKKHVRDGVFVWISPEGTRSRDGTLLPFKKGGFHLARQLEVPILPAWIDGTDRIIPADTFVAQYDQEVTVRFGAPIATAAAPGASVDGLMTEVRNALLSLSSSSLPKAAARAA